MTREVRSAGGSAAMARVETTTETNPREIKTVMVIASGFGGNAASMILSNPA